MPKVNANERSVMVNFSMKPHQIAKLDLLLDHLKEENRSKWLSDIIDRAFADCFPEPPSIEEELARR